VTVPAYPGEPFEGTISFVADTVNPTTRRILVRSTITNRDGRLKPEMLATLVIGDGAPRLVVIVPSSAVQTIDGASVVFVRGSNGRFAPRPVQLGRQDGGTTEVLSGLTDGEAVAITGSFVLKSELAKRAGGGQ
jgi:multidrug efflux pump subunit AcrA (membrane-fusion protein)